MTDGTLTAVDGYEPIVAYRLMRAEGTVLAEHMPEKTFTPASTLKLAVLAAAARGLAAGDLSLDQQVATTATWPSAYDGEPFGFNGEEVDPAWPTDGRSLPLGEILQRMIVISSNEATNMVYGLVGQGAVAQALTDAGCQHSALPRMYGDTRAAQHLGTASACTAGDLAMLMSAVLTGKLAAQRWSQFMTEVLARQRDAVIGSVVEQVYGEGTSWGSKSGWVSQIRHDVAFIGAPGPRALVLGVCTEGFKDHPSAVAAIRALTYGLLQGMEVSIEGVSPHPE